MLGWFDRPSPSSPAAPAAFASRATGCRVTCLARVESLEARVVMSAGVADAPSVTAATTTAPFPLGGNLQFQSENTRDHALADLVKASSGFRDLSGNMATVDTNGWPTEDFNVPLWGRSNVDPGRYTISYTGPSGANVSLSAGTGTLVRRASGTNNVRNWTLDVPSGSPALSLKFTGTAGQVKNLKVIQPGNTADQVWSSKYVNFLKSLKPDTIRVMDIVKTNTNTTSTWSQRPKLTDATFSRAGVPWEHLVKLANDLGSHIWVPVPARATDDYVRQLAGVIKAGLNPGLNVYLEYSNEVWSTLHDAGKYNDQQARAEVAAHPDSDLNYDNVNDPIRWAYRRGARRLTQIVEAFRSVWTTTFNGTPAQPDPINTRVKAVLGGRASQPQWFDDMLNYVDDNHGAPNRYFHGIGGAWYFSMNKYRDEYQNGQSTLTEDQVLEGLDISVSLYEDERRFARAADKAAPWGLKLAAYELGVDTYGELNISAKAAAHADPRMGALMERFVRAFQDQGGATAPWYTVGARAFDLPSGAWTVTDSLNNPNAPKAQAFRNLRAGSGPAPGQALLVSPTSLTVAEGGSAAFTVKLAAQPTSNVTVNVAKSGGGDGDLTTATGTLTFTPTNWNTAQNVPVAAAQDADTTNGAASFAVSSAGLTTKSVTATEADNDTAPVGPVTLRSGADTYVRDGSTYAGTNFGAAAQLQVKQGDVGWNRESYLRFDLSQVSTVNGAKLRLFGRLDNTAAASAGFTVFNSANLTWSETGTTWNNKLAAGTTARGSGTVTGTVGKWYELDLTSFLKAEKLAGRQAVTLVLKATAPSGATILFDSDEATNKPQLVVS